MTNLFKALLVFGCALLLISASAANTPSPALAPPPSHPNEDLRAAATRLATEIGRGDHKGVTSFQITVEGDMVAGTIAPSLQKSPPDLRSATKSVTALLVGIALDRGHIPSLRARIADLLPDLRAKLQSDPRKAAMTIEDLLTMRSGLDCDDWNTASPGHEDTMYEQRDWLAFWASQPMRDAPGTKFSYCTGNVIALGAVIARTSGMPVDRFAEKYLFAPLDIRDASWERWNRGSETDSGGHLRLKPADLHRIGMLVLAHGRWKEEQIVPASWIEKMTEPQTDVPGRGQRYGYLWWLDNTKKPNLPPTRLWMAWGNGGNYLIVMPEIRAIVSFTGTRFNQPGAMEPLVWLRDRLLPAMKAAQR